MATYQHQVNPNVEANVLESGNVLLVTTASLDPELTPEEFDGLATFVRDSHAEQARAAKAAAKRAAKETE